MNLSKLMPRFETDEVTDEEWEAMSHSERQAVIDAERKEFNQSVAPRHGPGTGVHFRTNGQVRRQQIRDAKSKRRKQQRAYNRSWMADQQRKANIRGQIQVLTDERFEGTAMRDNVERGLKRRHEALVAEYVDQGMTFVEAQTQVAKDLEGDAVMPG